MFDRISSVQWAWLCANIAKDKADELEEKITISDYIASYWNPESVKKVQEARKQKELDSKITDEEFIDIIANQDYKNNPLVDAIRRIKDSSQSDSEQNSLPLHSINLNRMIKEGI